MAESESMTKVTARDSLSSPDAKDFLSGDIYADVFEHILVGVAYHRMLFSQGDPHDYQFLYTNPAFHSHTGLGPVIGRRVSEVVPGIRTSNPKLFEIYGRVAAGGGPEKFETSVEALQRWFAIWVYSPKPEYLVAVFDDIAERKRQELKRIRAEKDLRRALRQVEQKERSRARFLAATSHDLRQPIYAAQLFLNSLAATQLDGQQLNSVKKVRQALTGMASQLKSLLDQSRQEDAQVQVLKRDTSTIDLFADMADIYGQIAQKANVRLLFRPADLTLHTDGNLLSRLLGNLIDNAIKFSPGGAVLVCARRSKGGHLLQVRDNGQGIADIAEGDELAAIVPIGNSGQTANAGYGLGLSIVSGIARLLGSEIRVASAPGKGSVFSLVMPS